LLSPYFAWGEGLAGRFAGAPARGSSTGGGGAEFCCLEPQAVTKGNVSSVVSSSAIKRDLLGSG